MGVKRGNLKLISGLLLPSFILNYILIRVKERGLEEEKNKKEQRETEKERERVERERNEGDSKDFEKIAC